MGHHFQEHRTLHYRDGTSASHRILQLTHAETPLITAAWGVCSPRVKRLQRRRQQAVTLIELMIVFLIIGILATIAIPQFLSFRTRAMQAEVKANFGALLRAESAFYAEHNSYTDDLSLLVWRPTGRPRYLYGFTSDALPAASGLNDSAELAAGLGTTEYETTGMVLGSGIPLTDADLPAGSVVTLSRFTFGAVANLDDDPALDQWQLSEGNVFTMIENDAN